MSPKLTILTVCKNAEETIVRACRSVDGQDLPPGASIEHLILDGDSTDTSLEVLECYETTRRRAGTASHVKRSVRSERDGGFYDAINRALSLACGDVIGILNADDFLAGNLIVRKILDALEVSPAHGIYGDLLYVRRYKGAWRQHRYWRSGRLERARFRAGWMPPHPTLYLRKSVYEELGGFRTDFASAADYEFILRLMKDERIVLDYIPEVLVCMETGGLSNRSLRNRWLAHRMDRRAWRENHLSPGLLTVPMKPLRKLAQFWQRKRDFVFPEWAHCDS
jgi:glycosyltransferase involved in cell wall biosynthesis